MAGTKWRIPWMTPQMLTPITNSQSPRGTSVSLVPCIGTPALLHAMGSLPKLRSADALVRAGETMGRLLDSVFPDVGHDHVRTSLRERGRNAEANAGSSAGYDGRLAGDVHSRGAFPMVNENSGRSR